MGLPEANRDRPDDDRGGDAVDERHSPGGWDPAVVFIHPAADGGGEERIGAWCSGRFQVARQFTTRPPTRLRRPSSPRPRYPSKPGTAAPLGIERSGALLLRLRLGALRDRTFERCAPPCMQRAGILGHLVSVLSLLSA